MSVRSIRNWQETLRRFTMPGQVAKQLLGDLIHYANGKEHEDEDIKQVVNFIHALPKWKTIPVQGMTVEQKAFLAFVINRFSSGGHPVATSENLDEFNPMFIGFCMGQVAAVDLKDKGNELRKELVAFLFDDSVAETLEKT
jgi:hypothetical protein